jgi:hypothetical protein
LEEAERSFLGGEDVKAIAKKPKTEPVPSNSATAGAANLPLSEEDDDDDSILEVPAVFPRTKEDPCSDMTLQCKILEKRESGEDGNCSTRGPCNASPLDASAAAQEAPWNSTAAKRDEKADPAESKEEVLDDATRGLVASYVSSVALEEASTGKLYKWVGGKLSKRRKKLINEYTVELMAQKEIESLPSGADAKETTQQTKADSLIAAEVASKSIECDNVPPKGAARADGVPVTHLEDLPIALPLAPPMKPAAPKMVPKRRQRAKRIVSNVETISKPEPACEAQPPVNVAPPARRTRAAPKRTREPNPMTCTLCSTCPCRFAKNPEEICTLNTSQSDAAIETTLMKQLEKLEKTAERYADQEDVIRRKLKNHRRDIWKKRERLQQLARQGQKETAIKCRFLPDVDELDEHFASSVSTALQPEETQKASTKVFGAKKSFQPTLTQFLGGARGVAETEKDICDDAAVNDLDTSAHGGFPFCESAHQVEQPVVDELPEAEPALVEKVHWVNGKASDGEGEPIVSLSSTMWSCLMSGRPNSTWDRIFDDPASMENMGMDDLLELLEDSEEETSDDEAGEAHQTPVDILMLSQRGHGLARSILERVGGDSNRLEAVGAVCPSWRENVCFALQQRDHQSLTHALQEVQGTKTRLERGRHALEKLLTQHDTALNLFEEALSTSLQRLDMPTQEALLLSQPPVASSPCEGADNDENTNTENDVLDGPGTVASLNEDQLPYASFEFEVPLPKGNDERREFYHKSAEWGLGRRSIETDAETLIPSASPRRSSITCHSHASTPPEVDEESFAARH